MVLPRGALHARELFEQHSGVLGGLNRRINGNLALIREALYMESAIYQGKD